MHDNSSPDPNAKTPSNMYCVNNKGKLAVLTVFPDQHDIVKYIERLGPSELFTIDQYTDGAKMYEQKSPHYKYVYPDLCVDQNGDRLLFRDKNPLYTAADAPSTTSVLRFTHRKFAQQPVTRDPKFVFGKQHLNVVEYNPFIHGPIHPRDWHKIGYGKTHAEWCKGVITEIID